MKMIKLIITMLVLAWLFCAVEGIIPTSTSEYCNNNPNAYYCN